MQKTRSYPHGQTAALVPLLVSYRTTLNGMIGDIWDRIIWVRSSVKDRNDSVVPMKQHRMLPRLVFDKQFKAALRNKYLQDWAYAAHWIDSAESNAFAIIKSWKKNYDKGDRGMICPAVRRLFARIKQSLLKLEGEKLRVTLKPGAYIWIDLSKRWFKLPDEISRLGLGEPTITTDMIHLPIFSHDVVPSGVPEKIGWDSNFDSFDGYSPSTGWVKLDTRSLLGVHRNSSTKLASIGRKFGRSPKGKRLWRKYQHRERNRSKKHQIEIARVMRNASEKVILETLNKNGMLKRGGFNYRLAVTDWRGIAKLAGERVQEVPSFLTSKRCSRCGWTNKDLKGAGVFECVGCGLRIDRQLNASIGIYEKAEGVPHDKEWWDKRVLPSLVGGYFQTGAESKAANELVRSLYEIVKPQVEYGYDRYEDAYLPKSPQARTRVRAA